MLDSEVIHMLVYILFALTFSTVLSALFSKHIRKGREGDAFIAFFVALMVLGWAVNEWLFPAFASGLRTPWTAIAALIVFGTVFASSIALSIRTPGRVKQPVMIDHDNRFDAEAAAFDLVLWIALLILGIIMMVSVGI
jgi:hypothetical protein